MYDFHHTVNVLVNAYMRNELAHGSCCACAVGNIIADVFGTRPVRDYSNSRTGFRNDCYLNGMEQDWYGSYFVRHTSQVLATGYTPTELERIEIAFEHIGNIPSTVLVEDDENYFRKHGVSIGQDDEWMFNGLMAVVDVLAEIHGVDLSVREQAKKLFIKV